MASQKNSSSVPAAGVPHARETRSGSLVLTQVPSVDTASCKLSALTCIIVRFLVRLTLGQHLLLTTSSSSAYTSAPVSSSLPRLIMPIFLELTVPVFARMHWVLFCLGPDTPFSVLSPLTPVTLGELPLASWKSFALGGGPDWFRQSVLQKATHPGDTVPRGRVSVPAPEVLLSLTWNQEAPSLLGPGS